MRETSTDYRRPHRPAPIRAANVIGARLARFGVRASLDPEDLMRAAGGGDFGDPPVLEPLSKLVDSIEREARLNPVGRVITRARLISALKVRREVRAAIDPATLAMDLAPPIVITGLQRTGTTLLHRLLASDPRLRWLASWEALRPMPRAVRPWHTIDPRIKDAERAERALAYLAPDFFAIHPVEAHAPEEEVLLLDYAFSSTVPEATLRVPSYSRWLEDRDQRPAYRYLSTLMRVLSSQRGRGKRWLLKTPHHLEWLDVLLEVFPGARIVWTHRDPTATLASFCSMIAHGRGVFSDEVDPIEIGRDWGNKIARMIDRAMDSRGRHESSFCDVAYGALLADPMAEVRRIYDFLGETLPAHIEARMRKTLADSPQHAHGKHRYRLEEFALDAAAVRARFARYRERFGL